MRVGRTKRHASLLIEIDLAVAIFVHHFNDLAYALESDFFASLRAGIRKKNSTNGQVYIRARALVSMWCPQPPGEAYIRYRSMQNSLVKSKTCDYGSTDVLSLPFP